MHPFAKLITVPVLALLAVVGSISEAAPRIESVVPLPDQPHAKSKETIWYDDFDGTEKRYGETDGALDDKEFFGGAGKSLPTVYAKGSQGKGGRKVFFGDSPIGGGKIVRKGESFDEIYWRVYVKHQPGWTGGGEAKLSRATSFVSDKWTQAMIAHVWSGAVETLTLDPVRGVRGDQVVTTRYNDFANFKWLGNNPNSNFRFSSAEESGWWVCVESHAKLNTPGKSDGVNRLWIDGRLEVERKNLDFRGNYTRHGINAVFLEAYWNDGSPVDQTRWIDQFVIATKPIGPVVCPRNPVLIRSQAGGNEAATWEVELAVASEQKAVVWESQPIRSGNRVTVDQAAGTFAGKLADTNKLDGETEYCCRIRQQVPTGGWTEWSPWHQSFKTGG